MPYISYGRRSVFNGDIDAIVGKLSRETSKELVYVLTKIAYLWLRQRAAFRGHPAMGFDDLAPIISVFETVKLEAYRRLIAPYEDNRLDEHGDVYS
jgi:hypothetical protein